jgi:hypothetical protein
MLSSKGMQILEALSAIHKAELKQLAPQLRRLLELLK